MMKQNKFGMLTTLDTAINGFNSAIGSLAETNKWKPFSITIMHSTPFIATADVDNYIGEILNTALQIRNMNSRG